MKRIEEIQINIDKSDPEFVFAPLIPIPSSDAAQEVPWPPYQMCLNIDVVKTPSQREAILLKYGGGCGSLP